MGDGGFANLMETDGELGIVDSDAEVAVVGVVVVFEHEALRLDGGIHFEIAHVSAVVRLLRRLAFLGLDEFADVVAAVAADDEGNLDVFCAEANCASEALVIVGVAGKDDVRVDILRFAYRIDVAKHVGAAAMIAAGA